MSGMNTWQRLGEQGIEEYTARCGETLAQHGQPDPTLARQQCLFCRAFRLAEKGGCVICLNCGSSSGCAE